jgi:hypothetical protein
MEVDQHSQSVRQVSKLILLTKVPRGRHLSHARKSLHAARSGHGTHGLPPRSDTNRCCRYVGCRLSYGQDAARILARQGVVFARAGQRRARSARTVLLQDLQGL